MEKSTEHSLHILSFYIKEIPACLNLDVVLKIIPLLFLQQLPNSPVYLIGIMNLSGESIPVIDLALRLGMHREQKYSINMPIIICVHSHRKIGLLVDQVNSLEKISSDISCSKNQFKLPSLCNQDVIALNNTLTLRVHLEDIFENSQGVINA